MRGRGAGRGAAVEGRGARGAAAAPPAHTQLAAALTRTPPPAGSEAGAATPLTLYLSTRRPYTVRNLAPPSYFLNVADSARNVVT